MTLQKIKSKITKLEEISNSNTAAAAKAKKLLNSDVTSHNVEEVEKLLQGYDRNR